MSITVRHHSRPELPANAVVIFEWDGDEVDVFMSEAHPLALVTACLNPLAAEFRARAGVGRHLTTVQAS
jgi:hypothetical protein